MNELFLQQTECGDGLKLRVSDLTKLKECGLVPELKFKHIFVPVHSGTHASVAILYSCKDLEEPYKGCLRGLARWLSG